MKAEKLVRWLHAALSVTTGLGMLQIFSVVFVALIDLEISLFFSATFIPMIMLGLGLLAGEMCGPWWEEACQRLIALIYNLRGEDSLDNMTDLDVESAAARLVSNVDLPDLVDGGSVAACSVVGVILVLMVSNLIDGKLFGVATVLNTIAKWAVVASSVVTPILLCIELIVGWLAWLILQLRVECSRKE